MSEDKAIHTLYERLKNLLYFQPYEKKYTNYCPNCGAKMKGVNDD